MLHHLTGVTYIFYLRNNEMKEVTGIVFLFFAALIGYYISITGVSTAMHQIYQGTLVISCILCAGFGCLMLKGDK